MNTKHEYGKLWGRQGYHFVISFPPGECSDETAYEIGQEFCRRLLSEYDYCFSVHNDQPHRHVHIVFNSVNRITGYKYRYEDGDWERLIQPVTDELCREYGLSELTYEKDSKRIGVSYAEHKAQKENRMTWKDIIRADIDDAISRCGSMEEYKKIMEAMGYRLRRGHSKKRASDYISYHAPGANRARRDYNLGEGYALEDIQKRIQYPETVSQYERVRIPPEELPVYQMSDLNQLQAKFILRIQQASGYLRLEISMEDQSRVRRDLLAIDRLREEATYLLDHDIESREEVEMRLAEIRSQMRHLKSEGQTGTEEYEALKADRRILMRIVRDSDQTMAVRSVPKKNPPKEHKTQTREIGGKQ